MSSSGLKTINFQIMTELNKQQELWQTTTPGMEYDRVLPAGLSTKKGFIPKENKFHVGNGQDGSAGKGTGRHIAMFVLKPCR